MSNFKSSELTIKFELILLPEPKMFLSSNPKVIPTPVSELNVPANSIFPVFVSSSILILMSANWLLMSVLVSTSFI